MARPVPENRTPGPGLTPQRVSGLGFTGYPRRTWTPYRDRARRSHWAGGNGAREELPGSGDTRGVRGGPGGAGAALTARRHLAAPPRDHPAAAPAQYARAEPPTRGRCLPST